MGKFDGKKLLILGTNVGAVEAVRYAQQNGAYVYATDYYPIEKSPVKRVADCALDISTGDLNKLGNLVKSEHIDGVFAGIHEFNILNAMRLSTLHGLPFYFNEDQWNLIEKKDNFRKLCIEFGVPCPETYYSGNDVANIPWDSIKYPAIIKPVDCGASEGVYICASEEELRPHVDEDAALSDTHRIIIEQICEGSEFTAHFTIVNGRAALACVDNRYPVAVHEGAVTTIPAARLYPSLFTSEFANQVEPPMIRLCESLGLDNAVIFIQGIYNSDTRSFSVFEAGLRSAAETPARFIECVNGLNYMNMLVDQCLIGSSDYDQSKEDPTLKGRCCGIVSFVARSGIVGAIQGLEEAVAATPSVIDYESRYPVGRQTPDTDTLRQLMIRFVMVTNSREEMARDIKYLNDSITVYDTGGNNMIIHMNPERVFGIK